jgi:hypothetical protein
MDPRRTVARPQAEKDAPMLHRISFATSILVLIATSIACSSSSNPPSSGARDAGSIDSAASDAGSSNDATIGDAGVGLTCAKLLMCDQVCTSTPCTDGCYDQSTGTAQGLFDAFNDCLDANCSSSTGGPCADPNSMGCSSCQESAATGACISDLVTCEDDKSVGPPDLDGGAVVVVDSGVVGDGAALLTCGQLAMCESACNGADASACNATCAASATSTAQSLDDALTTCLATHCPAADGGVCATPGSGCTGCQTQAEFDPDVCGTPFSNCQGDTSGTPDASVTPIALAGGTIVTLASGLDQPQVVIVNNGLVYYSQVSQTGAVSSVALVDAGAPATITPSQPYPMGLAVDSSNAYVWNSGSFSGSTTVNNSDGTVVQVPLAGGAAITLESGLEVAYAAPYLNAIAVSGSTVFWVAGATGHDGAIMAATVGTASGGHVLYGSQPFPEAVVTDGTFVYWTNWGTFDSMGNYNADGAVLKAPITGAGPVTTLASNQLAPAAIAIDANNVYWTNAGKLGGENLPAPGTGSVMQVSKSGTGITVLDANEAVPLGITVSASTVYWCEYTLSSPGQIQSIPIGGGARVAIAADLSDPFGITISGKTIVWSDSPPTQAGSGRILALTIP